MPDSFDTDDDGIADGVEPFGPFVGNEREPWTIRFDDGRDAYQTSSNPARADTDFDGLTDCQELIPTDDGTATGTPLACSLIDVYVNADGLATLEPTGTLLTSLRLPDPTDPAAIDTDGDGLTDVEELLGFRYEGLDGTTIDLRPSAGPATNPLSRDTDDDGLADRLELQLGSDPTNGDEDSVIDEDGDGLVNLQETTGWEVTWVDAIGERTAIDASFVDDPDSDDDGLTDWEEYHGCRDANRDLTCDDDARFGRTRPIFADSDADGLSDREEVDGVDFPGDDGVRFSRSVGHRQRRRRSLGRRRDRPALDRGRHRSWRLPRVVRSAAGRRRRRRPERRRGARVRHRSHQGGHGRRRSARRSRARPRHRPPDP
ncbi:MAG: hypothetical protein U5J97_00240 [Trueperaceae bacterium]|nr:hypothetical protein [Trueperaceae bacterium]